MTGWCASTASTAARETGRDGFSLLEILLAVSVLAIVLTAFYRLQAQTFRLHGETRFRTEAALLAREALARADPAANGEAAEESGDFGDDWPGYRWEVAISEVETEILGDAAADLKRMELTVFRDGDPRVLRLTTYRFARP